LTTSLFTQVRCSDQSLWCKFTTFWNTPIGVFNFSISQEWPSIPEYGVRRGVVVILVRSTALQFQALGQVGPRQFSWNVNLSLPEGRDSAFFWSVVVASGEHVRLAACSPVRSAHPFHHMFRVLISSADVLDGRRNKTPQSSPPPDASPRTNVVECMRRSVPIPNLGAALVSFDLKPLNNLLFFSVLLGIKSLIFLGPETRGQPSRCLWKD
jgi:hypothetical protein